MFKQQSSKYHPTHFYKRKKFPDKRGGGGGVGGPWPPGPTLKSALDLLRLLICFQHIHKMLIELCMVQFYL